MRKINENQMSLFNGGIRWGSVVKGFCSGIGIGVFLAPGGFTSGAIVSGACIAVGEFL